MTKGKLYERAVYHKKDDFDERDIEELLDNAKKEYPTFEQAKQELIKRIGHEWNDGLCYAAAHQVLTELRDKWALKWFGEPDQ